MAQLDWSLTLLRKPSRANEAAALGAGPEVVVTMITPEERRTGLVVVVVLVVIGLVFHKVETLVAGLLGLLAGIIAYVGALRAADRSVSATEQAAAKQVAAMQSQLDDAKAAREEDEKHKRKIERAYVSGGGARASEPLPDDDLFGRSLYPANARRLRLADGTITMLAPTNLFQLHINNHGKTPAYLHHVAIGFCDASKPPPEPVYDETQFRWDDAIGPGMQSRVITNVHFPEGRYARIAICGRYYWDDIWGTHWSSGFVYEIPSVAASASISIETPRSNGRSKYWDDREEEPPWVDEDGRANPGI